MSSVPLWQLVLLSLLFGCASRHAVPTSAAPTLLLTPDDCRSPTRPVTTEEALADIAVLQRIVMEGYAGTEVQRERGMRWESLFASLSADVQRAPSPLSGGAFIDLIQARMSVLGDNHASVAEFTSAGRRHYRNFGFHERPWISDEALSPTYEIGGRAISSCDAGELGTITHPVLTEDAIPRLHLLLLATSQPPPIHCVLSDGSSASFPLRPLRHGAQAPTLSEPNAPIPYLRVRSLASTEDTALRAFVDQAVPLRSAPVFILDIRGNSGGNDAYVSAFTAKLTNADISYLQLSQLISDVTLQGAVNSAVCSRAHSPDPETPATAEKRARDELARHLGEPPRTVERAITVHGEAPAPYPGRAILLQDGGCASSCEAFPLQLHQLAGTVILGENTGGVGRYGEILDYQLPNSRIALTVGSKLFRSQGPTELSPEGRGHLPDLYIDADDWLAVARSFAAACLGPDGCPRPR